MTLCLARDALDNSLNSARPAAEHLPYRKLAAGDILLRTYYNVEFHVQPQFRRFSGLRRYDLPFIESRRCSEDAGRSRLGDHIVWENLYPFTTSPTSQLSLRTTSGNSSKRRGGTRPSLSPASCAHICSIPPSSARTPSDVSRLPASLHGALSTCRSIQSTRIMHACQGSRCTISPSTCGNGGYLRRTWSW